MNESIHSRVKNMPNPSPGLLSILKRNPRGRIWATGYEGQALYSLKAVPLHTTKLRLGHPENILFTSKTVGVVRSRCFSGVLDLRSCMFHGGRGTNGFLVGMGAKGHGVYMIDVTNAVVEGLNTVGACFLSHYHCQFDLSSPRIKTCKFCKRKLYKKIVIKREVNWVIK